MRDTLVSAVEFEKFLQYVSNLEYDEKPDYKLIRKYFADALKSMGVAAKEKIDFNKELMPGSTRKRQSQPKAAKVIPLSYRKHACVNLHPSRFNSASPERFTITKFFV